MKRLLPTVSGVTMVTLMACGTLVGLGDRPSERGAGAGDASAGLDANGDGVSSDSPPPIQVGDAPLPASCLEVQELDPQAKSTVYTLDADGQVFDAFCDMDTYGGGWTVFFANDIGASHVIGFFDFATTDFCPDPGERCIRRVPSNLGPTTRFAALCGEAGVSFDYSDELVRYFSGQGQIGWVDLGNVQSILGLASTYDAFAFFGGIGGTGDTSPGTTGWIISSNDSSDGPTAETFASSYNAPPNGWDYCNGVDYNRNTGATPRVVLMYR